jgi:hypothetical protein
MAPVALPISSDRAILGIPVATYLHWSSALQNTQKSDVMYGAGELPDLLGS